MIKLSQTEPYTWHKLKSHPDRLDKAGPTAFEVSHNGRGQVCDRTDNGSIYQISGSKRSAEYLDTPIVEEK